MKLNKHLIKIVLGISLLVIFDLVFEYIITHKSVNLYNSLNQNYLLYGIICQSIMFLSGILLYFIFINKNIKMIFQKSNKIWKYLVGFIIIFPFILGIVYLLVYLLDGTTWFYMINQEVPDGKNLLEIIIFQSVFPGLGEEFLYRGFGLVLLLSVAFTSNQEIKKTRVIGAIVIIAIIFSLAHFSYQFNPFKISFDSYQLFTAFTLGVFEGYIFYKTKNIISSILIHNISNLFLTFFPILISIVF